MIGRATIELTDVNTGNKRTIEQHNLVTNAVNDILSYNPYGIMYKTHPATGETGSIGDLFLPVYNTLFGGIVLYKDALKADAANYYQVGEITGCANNEINTTTSTIRGSRNLTESGPITNGYKYVYDFTTAQGNGTISAMALTHVRAGVNGIAVYSYPYTAEMLGVGTGSSAEQQKAYKYGAEGICSIDKNGAGIGIIATDTKKLKITKWRTSAIGAPLTTKMLDEKISETEINTANFAANAVNYYNVGFVDDGDGYIWGFQISDNPVETTGGTTTILYVKIDKASLNFTEGSFTINYNIRAPGRQRKPDANDEGYLLLATNCLIKNGYLYLIKQNLKSLYKIDLSNTGSIKEIALPAGITVERKYNYTGYSYYAGYTALNCVGEFIYGNNFYLIGDTAIAKSNDYWLNTASHPCTFAGPYIAGIIPREGGSYSTGNANYRNIALPLNYQATIFNLDTQIFKTNSQTMKITYTLTES